MTEGRRLAGKLALVTGAGSGIGRATAHRFAEEGARVAVADWRWDAARETAGGLDGAIAVEVDVTSAAGVEAALKEVVEAFGGVDVVVNNAGVTIVGATHYISESDWDTELDTNLKSIYLVSKAAWPLSSNAAAAPSSTLPRLRGSGRSRTTRPTAPPRPA
jgi:NAD(P)-dependent dehydrogenase (short-subunit alcohol dehydrogenase family)